MLIRRLNCIIKTEQKNIFYSKQTLNMKLAFALLILICFCAKYSTAQNSNSNLTALENSIISNNLSQDLNTSLIDFLLNNQLDMSVKYQVVNITEYNGLSTDALLKLIAVLNSDELNTNLLVSFTNILYTNTYSASNQTFLIYFVFDENILVDLKSSIITLFESKAFDKTTNELILNTLAQSEIKLISQTYFLKILSIEDLDTQTKINLIKTLSLSYLSLEAQELYLETLSAENVEIYKIAGLINSVLSLNSNGTLLEDIVHNLSNIILSSVNYNKIISLFNKTKNASVILPELFTYSLKINNALDELNSTKVIDLLEHYDLSGCLMNCSNRGDCVYEKNELSCFCRRFFVGDSCESSYNPCFYSPCLNDGICELLPDVLNADLLDYNCVCNDSFSGDNCEQEFDSCFNTTCSNKGECYENEDGDPECDCYQYYSGNDCEYQEDELIMRKNVSITSSIIAGFILVALYGLILVFDILKYVFHIE